MQAKGKISRWQDEKGYGFIRPLLGGPQVFLHVSALQNRQRRPVIDEVVTYTQVSDEQGRLQAQDVIFAGEKPISATKIQHKSTSKPQLKRSGPRKPRYWQYVFAMAFLLLLMAGAVEAYLSWKVVLYYFVLSVLTLAFYCDDKFAAENRNWRTPESTLQMLALLGGWPGALIAQNLLRHKISKTTFLMQFWLMVFGNIIGLYCWCFTDYVTEMIAVLGGLYA